MSILDGSLSSIKSVRHADDLDQENIIHQVFPLDDSFGLIGDFCTTDSDCQVKNSFCSPTMFR